METDSDIPLDIRLVAELVRPEDLDPPNISKDLGKKEPM